MVVAIYRKCKEHDVTLLVEWKSREDPRIEVADLGSRLFDESSYSLNQESFAFLRHNFRHLPLAVDCMAQQEFAMLPRYFSRFPDPHAEGRNFFSQHLDTTTYYYCFPPPSFLHSVLLHFLKFECRGLLLVPVWPASSFWTLIAPDGVHLARWAVSHLKFRPSGFEVSPAVTSNTFRAGWFEMLGIQFDFLGLGVGDMGVSSLDSRTCLAGGCNRCSFSF